MVELPSYFLGEKKGKCLPRQQFAIDMRRFFRAASYCPASKRLMLTLDPTIRIRRVVHRMHWQQINFQSSMGQFEFEATNLQDRTYYH